jgi:hypothetical protein
VNTELLSNVLAVALAVTFSLLAAVAFFAAGTKSMGHNPDKLRFPALLGLCMLAMALVAASTL